MLQRSGFPLLQLGFDHTPCRFDGVKHGRLRRMTKKSRTGIFGNRFLCSRMTGCVVRTITMLFGEMPCAMMPWTSSFSQSLQSACL
ncbi:unnamed protein product [Sphagnum balticum]